MNHDAEYVINGDVVALLLDILHPVTRFACDYDENGEHCMNCRACIARYLLTTLNSLVNDNVVMCKGKGRDGR